MSLLNNLQGAATAGKRTTHAGQITPVLPELPADFVKGIVNAADAVPDRSRTGAPGYTHVSSLVDVCVRQYVLAATIAAGPSYQAWTGGHRVTFAIGRATEAHVKKSFILGAGNTPIYGEWECRCGRTKHVGLKPTDEIKCGTCGGKLQVYMEPVLRDDIRKIVGSPDLSFMLGEFMVPVECKSISKKEFEKIVDAPKGDHILQALLYRHLYQAMGFQVHDEVIVFYVQKEFKWGRPYAEFHVDATEFSKVALVDLALSKAVEIRNGIADAKAPPRTRCQTQADGKNCPMVTQCFSMEIER